MMSGRKKKPTTSTRLRRSKPKTRSPNPLDRMAPSESAIILRTLLIKHPELQAEAEQIAVDMISKPSVENVAKEVRDAVTSLKNEGLHDRAGQHSWGYEEPTEAAREMLGEAVEDVVVDMKRRAKLGLCEAAEAICCGIVLGLHGAKAEGSEELLGWAPDFPTEEACQAVTELIEAASPRQRAATRARLVKKLGELVPDWNVMIARAADRAMRNRR